MKRLSLLFVFFVGLFFLEFFYIISAKSQKKCQLYLSQQCEKTISECTTIEECQSDIDQEQYCYVLWNKINSTDNSNGNISNVVIQQKGCWTGGGECSDNSKCVEKDHKDPNDLLFCCCYGDLCNTIAYHEPGPTPSTISLQTPKAPISYPVKQSVLQTLIYSLIPIIGVTILIIATFWMYRQFHASTHTIIAQSPSPIPSPSPLLGKHCYPCKLLEIKARGRFGCVWKAQLFNDYVAVKNFPVQDKYSWQTEQDIYSVMYLYNHDNILRFIAAERRGDGLNQELWLITEFHANGSLCDYLKANLVSWDELCLIGESMASGLTFLHEDIPSTRSDIPYKPAIAHRDFKSKNVLLKRDLTVCIADFGLAVKFEPGQPLGDMHGQVGTRRYMAPEVLEGAISFTKNAFLRIDMYACGLVLWEVLSRCSAIDGPVGEYMLPFEEEIGQAPSLEDLKEALINRKLKPHFKEQWLNHAGMIALCETIDECLDHDTEARLPAGCVEERLSQLRKLSLQNQKNNELSQNQFFCKESVL